MSAPLKTPRAIVYFFSFATGVIALASGINAFVKRNRDARAVQDRAPAGVTVRIDTSSVTRPGLAMTIAAGLLALLSLFSLALLFASRAPKPRGLLFQTAAFGVLTLWLLGSTIATTAIGRNKSAIVQAFTGGIQLPDSIVKSQAARLGISPSYWSKSYIKFLVIAPWFAFLFALLATIVTFMAHSRAKSTTTTARADDSREEIKPDTQQVERV